MSKPFEIKFDFPVADSTVKIFLKATAKLHHSEPYYVIQDFYLERDADTNTHHSILPDQEVKRLKRNGSFAWVHRDSERESLLSIAIGEGIEKAMKENGKEVE